MKEKKIKIIKIKTEKYLYDPKNKKLVDPKKIYDWIVALLLDHDLENTNNKIKIDPQIPALEWQFFIFKYFEDFDVLKSPRNKNPKYWKEKTVLFFYFLTEYAGKERCQIPNLIDAYFEKTEKNFLDFKSRDIKKYNNIQITVFIDDFFQLVRKKIVNQEEIHHIKKTLTE